MHLFSAPDFDHHEQIVFLADRESGLRAIIAIHDTSLGPAVGGLRMWPYPDQASAVTDALRLARGMTYKSAAAGLSCGGGKAVIIGDPHKDKSEALFRAFGRRLNTLSGLYYTAEDVGTSPADMDAISTESRFVLGRSTTGGDPSPTTAKGVFHGIEAAVRHRLGSDLAGVRVAVQGLGSVGYDVARRLREADAVLTVADISAARVRRAERDLGATAIGVDEIVDAEVDVLAPCALGGIVNDETIGRFRCRVIAGAANNQLLEARHGNELHRRGILYAPDYVINAGGIIQIAAELGDGPDPTVHQKVSRIGDILTRIFERSAAANLPTHVIADRMAEERLEAAREGRLAPAPVRAPSSAA
jgi:leucine dehydrogenase